MKETINRCECGHNLYVHIAPHQGEGKKGRRHVPALICWNCGRLYKCNGDLIVIMVDGKYNKIGTHDIDIEGVAT